MKIGQLLSKLNYEEENKWLNFFNLFMILYGICCVLNLTLSIYYYTILDLNNWQISDWVINYQGGFVRRGLLGEVILKISQYIGIYPNYIVFILTLSIFILCCYLFYKLFSQKKYCWWVLSMATFLYDVTPARKDYLVFLCIILVYYIYTSIDKRWLRILLVNIVGMLASNFHEAFFLFSIPLLFLVIVNDKSLGESKIIKMLYLLPSFIMFGILASYKGDLDTALAITNSLQGVMPHHFPQEPFCSIEALGWSVERFHWEFLHYNVEASDFGINVLMVRPFFVLLLLYLFSNLFSVIKYKGAKFTLLNQRALLAVLYFQLFFAILLYCTNFSDFTRLMEYWLCSSYLAYLLLPSKLIVRAFPRIYVVGVSMINRYLIKVIKPSTPLFIFLILVMGGCSCGFKFYDAWSTSVLGRIFNTVTLYI